MSSVRLLLLKRFLTSLTESNVDCLLKIIPDCAYLRTKAPTKIPEVRIDAVFIILFIIKVVKKNDYLFITD